VEEPTRSLSEVAGAMGVSERTVRRWIKSGRLKAYKPGRDYRIPEAALRQFIEESEVRPKAGVSPSLELSFNDVLDEEWRQQSVEVVRKRYRDMRDHLDPYLTHWEQRLAEDDLDRQAVEEFLLAAKAFIPILMVDATQNELNDIAQALGYEERGAEVLAGLSRDSLVLSDVLTRYCRIGDRLTQAWSEGHASDAELAEIIDFGAELQKMNRRLVS
jgi:excisionase family DNA binding protein